MTATKISPKRLKALQRDALKRGHKLREKFRKQPKPFEQSDFRKELARECQDLAAAAYEGWIDGLASKIDEDATTAKWSRDKQPCLPGFDLDGEYRIGDGTRIAKRHAQRDHMEAALQLSDSNLASVTEANKQLHEEFDRLEKYLTPTVTKQQAIAAYLADHSGES